MCRSLAARSQATTPSTLPVFISNDTLLAVAHRILYEAGVDAERSVAQRARVLIRTRNWHQRHRAAVCIQLVRASVGVDHGGHHGVPFCPQAASCAAPVVARGSPWLPAQCHSVSRAQSALSRSRAPLVCDAHTQAWRRYVRRCYSSAALAAKRRIRLLRWQRAHDRHLLIDDKYVPAKVKCISPSSHHRSLA
jgi:hypothetical protein